jgi:hypothetical protein
MMNILNLCRHSAARAGVSALLACLAVPAVAATKPADPAEQRYQLERADCLSGRSPQPRDVCLKEAGAAREEARRQGLSSPTAEFTRNQLQRCQPLPPADRQACIARMSGAGTTRGSVAEGGVLRELTTRTVGPAASAASATASGASR